MNKIGQGYYYDVYDLGNSRVLKKRTGHLVRLNKLLTWYGKTPFSKFRIVCTYPKYVRSARNSLASSLKISLLDPEIFGNPSFTDDFEYTQDKATPLKTYFENHALAENKARFSEYPRLLHTIWAYGFSDTVFNFTINNGVSLKTNKLIYMDFNEFTQSKEKIRDCIKKEKWRTQASLRDMSEGELKEYILSLMRKEVTLQNLDKFWGRSNKNIIAPSTS